MPVLETCQPLPATSANLRSDPVRRKLERLVQPQRPDRVQARSNHLVQRQRKGRLLRLVWHPIRSRRPHHPTAGVTVTAVRRKPTAVLRSNQTEQRRAQTLPSRQKTNLHRLHHPVYPAARQTGLVIIDAVRILTTATMTMTRMPTLTRTTDHTALASAGALERWSAVTTTIASSSGSTSSVWVSRNSLKASGCVQRVGSCRGIR